MKPFENYIVIEKTQNISDTFIDLLSFNRIITRNQLIFTGCSLFDIQFLYPLFSELTFPSSFLEHTNPNYTY
jgi:hypothetical protein